MQAEIASALKNLEGRSVSFFDKTGGCLDVNLNYIRDWWEESNTFFLTKFIGKFILVHPVNEPSRVFKIKTSLITSVEDNDITF